MRVIPSERIVSPLAGIVLRRCIHPPLELLGLPWVNLAVVRRSHSFLYEESLPIDRVTAWEFIRSGMWTPPAPGSGTP
jgi:hypothetical protein